jgi:hypothetical protein
VFREQNGPGFESGNVCLYDECTVDTDCANGGVCHCASDEGMACQPYCNCPMRPLACTIQWGGRGGVCGCGEANVCVLGTESYRAGINCHVDSDCGDGGFCSPGIDICFDFAGYFCHRPGDGCFDDSDCDGGGMYCLSPADPVGGWRCGHPNACP